MNNLSRCFALLFGSAVAVTPLLAALESFKIEITEKPQLSPVMQMEGVTKGAVVVAVDISATGELTDYLVLGTTHRALERPCIEAMKRWRFTPARLDGQPVPVQADLTIQYTAEGVVVSRPAILDVDQHMQQLIGYQRMSWRHISHDLEQPPTPVAPVSPRYAQQAEKEGVRGAVRVHFFIDETGAVRMPAIEGDAHPYLSSMALEAVRSWKFKPAIAKGKPVLVAARQDFQFNP